MKIRRAWSVAKYVEEASSNEDAYAYSRDGKICAISDGASDSFDSATWAKMLVGRYVSVPECTSRWVDELVSQYNIAHSRESLSWSAQGAWDRGSFATLLGIRIDGDYVHLEAIGDCLAILADGTTLIDSFPYLEPDQFSNRPVLVSTKAELNDGVFDVHLGLRSKSWKISGIRKSHILLMSDALGEWSLRHKGIALEVLLNINSTRDFEKFVTHERSVGRLRRDDTSLLVLR